jgi:hypothetical protein
VRLLVLILATALAVSAADNTLSPEEQREGFKLLFDGRTFRNWQDPSKKNQPGDAWIISDGTFRTKVKPWISEDLLSERQYGDFELRWEWKVALGGNTGLKYRLQKSIFVDESKIQKGPGGFEGLLGREVSHPKSDRTKLLPAIHGFEYTVGFEYQLIDDERHPDAKRGPDRRTGALYSMIPPIEGHAKPAGEWNSSRLIVRGDHVQHWLNGTKVLDASLKDERVIAGVNKRWKDVPSIREALTKTRPLGYIALQHHEDEVWFRNIRIHELK